MAHFGRVCPFLCGAAGLAEQMQDCALPLLSALNISASTLQQRVAFPGTIPGSQMSPK